jgi:hypothetical protein
MYPQQYTKLYTGFIPVMIGLNSDMFLRMQSLAGGDKVAQLSDMLWGLGVHSVITAGPTGTSVCWSIARGVEVGLFLKWM